MVVSETLSLATAQRRGSGSLSPRLIQFKRRESIDSIINEEKNHEHEINDLKNLNSKVEDLFGRVYSFVSDQCGCLESKAKKLTSSDTPSNSPKRRHLGKQVFFLNKENINGLKVFIPSISSTCSSPTRPYQRAQSPLTSTAGSTPTCRKRRFTDQEEFSPISKVRILCQWPFSWFLETDASRRPLVSITLLYLFLRFRYTQLKLTSIWSFTRFCKRFWPFQCVY